MNIIFQITGGIGKVIAATAVCEVIAKQFPSDNLVVISGYPEVFLGNSNVKSYRFGELTYFYETYLEGQKDYKIFVHDPYNETSHIQEKKHLIESWCKMFNLKYEQEQPRIYLTDREYSFNENKFTSDKPILVLQTNGGAENQPNKYSWARDIPAGIVMKVIEHFKEQYNIVHIRRQDQFGYEFTTPVTDGFRNLCSLLKISQKRLLMDSFAQHACAAMDLPATVLWIVNKPTVFGYKLHDNILANPFTQKPELRHSYLSKFSIGGEPLEFPYLNEAEIFDADKVIASLEKK